MKRLIVDGYNVLHADPRYAALADEDLDVARARLVEDVAAYCLGDAMGVVVFDGGGNPASDGKPHHVAGITVLFSRAGETADTVIERLARRSREHGEHAVVVTSDAATQWVIMGSAVVRMSSAEFVRAVRSGATGWTEHNPTGARKGAVQERIDPSVRATLARWARGEASRSR